MIAVLLKWDVNAIVAKLNDVQKNLGTNAVNSALNKTAAQSKTQMSKAIRATYNISAALVAARLRVSRATRKSGTMFTAALIGNPESGGGKRAMNLIHFVETKTTMSEARKRRKIGTLSRLHFKIKRGAAKASIPGAFIGNSGRTVFVREGPARLPIRAVYTIGVPQMFSTKANVKQIKVWIEYNFPRLLEHEVKFYLSRAQQ